MILLDTHVWLWWITAPNRLTDAQREALSEESFNAVAVSAVSCWEVALAASRGRMALNKPASVWIEEASVGAGVEIAPLTAEIAVASVLLPDGLHQDPADRFIVATARTLGCPLLTADGKILAYEHVETIG